VYFTDQLKVNEGSCGFDRTDQKERGSGMPHLSCILEYCRVVNCITCEGGGGVQVNVLNGHVFPRASLWPIFVTK